MCQAMDGRLFFFFDIPERPHPHCKCRLEVMSLTSKNIAERMADKYGPRPYEEGPVFKQWKPEDQGSPPARTIHGNFSEHGTIAKFDFEGRNRISVTFKSMDVTFVTGIPGVHVVARAAGKIELDRSTGWLLPGRSVTFSCSTTHAEPVPWSLECIALGSDNMLIWYKIEY